MKAGGRTKTPTKVVKERGKEREAGGRRPGVFSRYFLEKFWPLNWVLAAMLIAAPLSATRIPTPYPYNPFLRPSQLDTSQQLKEVERAPSQEKERALEKVFTLKDFERMPVVAFSTPEKVAYTLPHAAASLLGGWLSVRWWTSLYPALIPASLGAGFFGTVSAAAGISAVKVAIATSPDPKVVQKLKELEERGVERVAGLEGIKSVAKEKVDQVRRLGGYSLLASVVAGLAILSLPIPLEISVPLAIGAVIYGVGAYFYAEHKAAEIGQCATALKLGVVGEIEKACK